MAIDLADPYDFLNVAVGGFRDVTFTVTNSGDAQATSMGSTLTAPYSFKDGSFPGTGGDCSSTLDGISGTNTCTLVVTFSPIATGLAITQTLNLNYNDGAAAQITPKGLTGNALPAALITMDQADPYDFGTIAAGSSRTVTCLLYTSPSPRDQRGSRMPSSA